MKKLLSFVLLGLSITSLVGCTPAEEEPVDKNPIEKIIIQGTMQKKEYKYDDEWDVTGLKVKGTRADKSTEILDPSLYTFSFSRKAPRNYANSLQITAVLKNNAKIFSSVSYRDIKVEDEIYDSQAEINSYYKDCKLTLTGSSLMNELHRHSFAKHTKFIKYSETQEILAKYSKTYDCEAPDLIRGEHKIEMFYTGDKTSYSIGTREHVWACADSAGLWAHGTVDSKDYYGGGSDLFHIRPSNGTVNQARGDAPFVDFDDSEFSSLKSKTVDVGDNGPYTLKCYKQNYTSGTVEYSDYVEVDDNMKGDVARIIAYIYMHYNRNTKTPSSYKSLTGSLDLTRALGYSNVSKVKSELIRWNKLDPVSEVEAYRNHTVQQVQGNRNPFVDYPDLMDKVFG